ncbi:MAG: SLBB domain-containing protein [Chitinispirillaceae bacterium]|nr:SLBB domain-containing protein [Chitinispirillaceae bacterium]
MPRFCRCIAVFIAALAVSLSFAQQQVTPAQIDQGKAEIAKDPANARKQINANPQLMDRLTPSQRAEIMQAIRDAERTNASEASSSKEATTETSAEPSQPEPDAESQTFEEAAAVAGEIATTDEQEKGGKGAKAAPRETYGRGLFRQQFLHPKYAEIPDDYVIAPGDEILLRFWGTFNQERKYLIGKDGYVFIEPLRRQAYLTGMTFGALRKMVERVSDASPGVQGDVRVVNAHPIYVHVSGAAAKPGTVSAPAYYTFWQFLILSKGPSTIGSVRDIRVMRRSKEVSKIDIYDFLRTGKKPMVALQNEDLIFFGEAKKTVLVGGLVRKAGVYELKEGERLGDLVTHAGGLAAGTLAPGAQIQRTADIAEKAQTGFPYKLMEIDLARPGWEKTELIDGDIVIPRKLNAQFANDVYIGGTAVAVPGRYSLPESPWSADDLVRKAGGLVSGAYRTADLVRTNPDGSRTIIPLDLFDAAKLQRLYLKAMDNIFTYGEADFIEQAKVTSRGFVRSPIDEQYSDSLTLLDVIRKSRGVREGGLPYAYIKRTDTLGNITYHRFGIADSAANAQVKMERRDEVLFFDYREFNRKLPVTVLAYGKEPLVLGWSPDLTLEVIIHELGGIDPLIDSTNIEICVPDFREAVTYAALKVVTLSAETASLRGLVPQGAVVFLRKNPDKEYGRYVTITGEVLKPGRYPLLRRDSRLAEIFALAGGLTERGNKWAIAITRGGKTIPVEVGGGRLSFVNNWVLNGGDAITVGRNDYSVEIAGAVFDPRISAYHPGYSWKDYVKKGGGGALDTADMKRAFVQYPNGVTKKAHAGWFIFSSNADVYPGSRVVVPLKPYVAPPRECDEDKTDWTKPISIISGTLLSIVSLMVIANNLK